jgi:hypothetical protein
MVIGSVIKKRVDRDKAGLSRVVFITGYIIPDRKDSG